MTETLNDYDSANVLSQSLWWLNLCDCETSNTYTNALFHLSLKPKVNRQIKQPWKQTLSTHTQHTRNTYTALRHSQPWWLCCSLNKQTLPVFILVQKFLVQDQTADSRFTCWAYLQCCRNPKSDRTCPLRWRCVGIFNEFFLRARRQAFLIGERGSWSVESIRKLENAKVPYIRLLLFRPSTCFYLSSSPHWILRPLYCASDADVWSLVSRYGVCRSCNERARSIAGQEGMVFSFSTSLADLRVKQGAYVCPWRNGLGPRLVPIPDSFPIHGVSGTAMKGTTELPLALRTLMGYSEILSYYSFEWRNPSMTNQWNSLIWFNQEYGWNSNCWMEFNSKLQVVVFFFFF